MHQTNKWKMHLLTLWPFNLKTIWLSGHPKVVRNQMRSMSLDQLKVVALHLVRLVMGWVTCWRIICCVRYTYPSSWTLSAMCITSTVKCRVGRGIIAGFSKSFCFSTCSCISPTLLRICQSTVNQWMQQFNSDSQLPDFEYRQNQCDRIIHTLLQLH